MARAGYAIAQRGDHAAISPARPRPGSDSSATAAGDEEYESQDQTHYEKNPGDVGGSASDAAKSKQRSDDGNDQESKSPIEHKMISIR